MVLAKTELFTDKLRENALLFKALAHPARLQILLYLSKTKTCISGDISHELPLSRTTVNQHLNELKKVGLIQGHIHGVKMNYCLNPVIVNKLKTIMNELTNELEIDDSFICE
ncbi:MAG: winged helix-turn-helix transcriptional regulator [Chlorobi bacterium]|nr:winged helix-turn-helix transcriptional regulator [Chlorobiota bacterium]